MKQERWKPVVGYEGLYEVSDMGRVRSLDRSITRIDGRVYFYPGRLLKGSSAAGHYRTVYLSGYCRRYIHHIVAEAFIGKRPVGMDVLHDNDKGMDNRLQNLRYGHALDNMEDARKNGNGRFNKQHWAYKYSVQLISRVQNLKGKISSRKAEIKTGIPARYIRQIWAGGVRTRG